MRATAASTGISGRIMTDSGRDIRNVSVTMNGAGGNERTTQTKAFGY
jgi:hypothetical protein